MRANDLSNFTFVPSGYGVYKVIYTTGRGDRWIALITDMELIDATKNAEWAKAKDIRALRDAVKSNGKHYHKMHNIIY